MSIIIKNENIDSTYINKTCRISIEDEKYPKKLKKIKNAPEVLYYRGTLPKDDTPTVSIVGARNSSEYGLTTGRALARELSRQGVQVISGLALGCDTSAHIGALDVNAPNFAVLGCGVDLCYPTYNQDVYNRILDCGGGIISELPDGTPAYAGNFPMRNRIISGLSDVVIVLEAKLKSGSLITANYAVEQGRDIFALPGRISDTLSQGTNDLIRQGAYILSTIYDVLDYFQVSYGKKILPIKFDVEKLSYDEKIIYKALKELGSDSHHIDEIVEKTNISQTKCILILTTLQINGYVESNMPSYYKICDEPYYK